MLSSRRSLVKYDDYDDGLGDWNRVLLVLGEMICNSLLCYVMLYVISAISDASRSVHLSPWLVVAI